MTTIPSWLAAVATYPGNAGLVNQFLATHTAFYQYSGAQLTDSQTTGTGLYQSTQSQWLSQAFTTGNTQTELGSVSIQLSVVGGSPTLNLVPVITVAIYADSGGVPTGSALASALLSNNYVYSSSFWVSVPLPTAVTVSTVYHIVTNMVGSTGHYYTWQQSNQASGAATSPDNVTWTNQTYGLMYKVYDQTGSGNLVSISQDDGSSLTTFTYNSLNQLSSITQFVTAQDGNYIQSSGTLSYTNGLVTGVS